jgi:hypothetical protein
MEQLGKGVSLPPLPLFLQQASGQIITDDVNGFFLHLGYLLHGLPPLLFGFSFKIPSLAAGVVSAYKDTRLRLGAT